jgi:hypothetical protein
MAAECVQCKKPIGCGCQKTQTSDNKIIHKDCKEAYEKTLKEKVNL